MGQSELLRIIGPLTNARLRELHRLLTFYKYGQQELALLKMEILAALPKRSKKRLDEERSVTA